MSAARQPKNGRYRVVVIDDYEVVRKGLVHLINHEPDLVVSGEAVDARAH